MITIKPLRPLPVETKRLLQEGQSNVEAGCLGEAFWRLVESKVDEWLDEYDHYDLSHLLQGKLYMEIARLVVLRRRERQLRDER